MCLLVNEDGEFISALTRPANYDPTRSHYFVSEQTFEEHLLSEEEREPMNTEAIVLPIKRYNEMTPNAIWAWQMRQQHIEEEHGSALVLLTLNEAADTLVKHFDPDELYEAMRKAQL